MASRPGRLDSGCCAVSAITLSDSRTQLVGCGPTSGPDMGTEQRKESA